MATRRRRFSNMPTAGGGGHKRSLIHQTVVTLTDTQIKALPTTPQEIVAAPGAGRVHIVDLAAVVATTVVPYTNFSSDVFSFARFWYGENDFATTYTSPNTAGFDISALFVNGRITLFPGMLLVTHETSKDSPVLFVGPDTYAGSDIANQPLVFVVTNTAGDFEDGDADNTLLISVSYRTFNVSTGVFE